MKTLIYIYRVFFLDLNIHFHPADYTFATSTLFNSLWQFSTSLKLQKKEKKDEWSFQSLTYCTTVHYSSDSSIPKALSQSLTFLLSLCHDSPPCFCGSSVFATSSLSIYLWGVTKGWSLIILFYTFSELFNVFLGFLNLYSQDNEIAISKIFQSFDLHIYLLISFSGFSWEILKLNMYKNIYFFSCI